MKRKYVSRLAELIVILSPLISIGCVEDKSDNIILREIKFEEPVTIKLIQEDKKYLINQIFIE